MAFVEHTETSNPPQLIKDMANLIKIKSGKKSDMQKVEEILKAMNSRDIVGYGNLRNHPLSDIIKDEKIYYESCGDYANVFVSLCRELGFPAVYVQGAEIGNGYSDVEEYRAKQRKLAEAHMNVEVYLPDMNKWILVEPHFCQVIEEYDTANPYVGYNGESVNLPKDGVYYFYIKSANNQFSRPHEFVLENIDTKVDITEQKYSKDYDFER